jgi:hypothetical protein
METIGPFVMALKTEMKSLREGLNSSGILAIRSSGSFAMSKSTKGCLNQRRRYENIFCYFGHFCRCVDFIARQPGDKNQARRNFRLPDLRKGH